AVTLRWPWRASASSPTASAGGGRRRRWPRSARPSPTRSIPARWATSSPTACWPCSRPATWWSTAWIRPPAISRRWPSRARARRASRTRSSCRRAPASPDGRCSSGGRSRRPTSCATRASCTSPSPPSGWRSRIHPDDRERAVAFADQELAAGRDFVHEYRMLASDGRVVWMRDSVTISAGRVHSLKVDVTARKRTEALLAGESRVLTLIAGSEPLPTVLDALCRVIEEQDADMLCSVLMVEDGRMRSVAGPRLPETYVQAVDPLGTGPAGGVAGVCAFRRQPVIVEDLATDALGEPLRAAAQAHGLRACWALPVLDVAG